jgi:hypothetical protein
MARPQKILACMFQGGGNIPLILPILAELVARNHRVRVMVGPVFANPASRLALRSCSVSERWEPS